MARFRDHRDEAAFRRLFRLHSPQLYRIAYRLVGSDADSQDTVQETWIRAAIALPEFRWESKLSTWLVGILLNCCRELRRAERPDQFDLEERNSRAAASPIAEGIDLERALSRLAPGYREVLLLHDVEGYTHEEIAQILSIDPGTSKSQLSRARSVLRDLLEPRDQNERK